jgi:hypothetical protein
MIGFSYREEEEEGLYYIFVVSHMAMMAEDAAIIATVHPGLMNSDIEVLHMWSALNFLRSDMASTLLQEDGSNSGRGNLRGERHTRMAMAPRTVQCDEACAPTPWHFALPRSAARRLQPLFHRC